MGFIDILTSTLWHQCLLHHHDVTHLNTPILQYMPNRIQTVCKNIRISIKQVLLEQKWAKKHQNKPKLGRMTSYRSCGGR